MTPAVAKVRRYCGLTLAEVLATITIIAIVIPVVMQGISISSGLASVTKQRAHAVVLAESKLDELVLSGEWQSGAGSGDFSPDYPEFTWQTSIADWDETGMMQLQIQVQWMSRGVQRDVTLTTLVYDSSTTGGQGL